MASRDRIIVCRAGNLTSQFLERLALRLWDEQRSEAAEEHEQGKDLHHMIEPRRGSGSRGILLGSPGPQGAEDDLCDNGADLARGCRETVRRRPVSRGEAFTRDDKGLPW